MFNPRSLMFNIKLILVCLSFVFFAASCNRPDDRDIRLLTGGDPSRGIDAIHAHGCATCHTIPGIRGAEGLVGAPLDRIGSRVYLAGRIQNTPENMIHWVRFPKQVDPETAMPQMDISEQEGRDIAAFLYTLR
jgi:cytochrome c